jgi:glycogen debranching enzyme
MRMDIAKGAIALAEVQGYVYAAKVRLSQLARLQGDRILRDRWQAEAAELKHRFEKDFWLADEGYLPWR